MRDPRTWLGILVSIAATALLLYVVDPSEVVGALRRADPVLVGVYVLLVPLALWVRCVRWRLLYPRPEAVRVAGLSEALYIGYMVNTLLPLRAGELVRAFLAAESESTSRSTSLATVLIEKVLDLGTVAFLLFILGLVFPDLPDSARYAALLSGIGLLIAGGCVAFALLARVKALVVARWLETRVSVLAKIGVAGILSAFLDGLAFARHPLALAQVAFWTVVLWSLAAVSVGAGMVAVGIRGTSSYELAQMALLVLVVTNLSMAVPSAPGYVGVFHGVFVATLALFGVREESAAAAAVLEHALSYGFLVVVGAYYVLRGRALKASGRRLGQLVAGATSGAREAV